MAQNDSSNSHHLVDESAAAKYLSLAVPTLRKWRVAGGGPAFMKFGRAVRYDMADLDGWIACRRHSSTSAADAKLSDILAVRA